jgi:hypothetical protein
VELLEVLLIKISDSHIKREIENIQSGFTFTIHVGKLFLSRLLKLRPDSFNITSIKNVADLDEYIWENL